MAWLSSSEPIAISKDVAIQTVFDGKASVWLDPSVQSSVPDKYVRVLATITTEVWEYRGLTRAAALAMVGLTAHASGKPSAFYAYEDANNHAVRYSVYCPGAEDDYTQYVAVRANEADGWRVTKTRTVTTCEQFGLTTE